MAESTAQAIARAAIWVNRELSRGTLRSRLCFDCGDVKHPGHICAEIPALKSKEPDSGELSKKS